MNRMQHGLIAGQYLRAVAIANGNLAAAHSFADGQGWSAREEIGASIRQIGLKAAVSGIGVTGGLQGSPVGIDFLQTLRPLEIFGRLARAAKRPIRTRILTWASGTAGAVVGEGAAIPVSRGGLTSTVVQPVKITALTVATSELLRVADAEADQSIATELAAAVALAADRALVDPAVTGSVLSGSSSIASTGSSVANIDADLEATIDALLAGGSNLSTATWILSPKTATHLALLRSGGQLAYPNIGAAGGTLAGLPAFTSGAVGNYIALIDEASIVLAEDEDVQLDRAESAAIEMLDNPTGNLLAPTTTSLVSVFQVDSVALRATLYRGWFGRPGCGAALIGVNY